MAIVNIVDDENAQSVIRKNGLTNDATPTINGTATPGAEVKIYDNGQLMGTTTANVKGEWSFTPTTPLPEGSHNFSASVMSQAQIESAPTAGYKLTLDTTAPVNGGIESLDDDVGIYQGTITNGGVTDDTTPTLMGKGTPGDIVSIIDNGEVIDTVVVGKNGEWSYTPVTPLNDGEHQFQTQITDKAGNSSELSEPYVVIIDTVAPDQPAITEVFDDQGDSTGALASGAVTDDATPTIKGTAEANGSVNIYDNGVLIGSAKTEASGNWTFEPSTPLTDGAHSLTVVAADAAGNESATSDSFSFSVASGGAPATPVIVSVTDDVGDIQGPLQRNAVTDDARPTVSGTAPAGSIVTVYANGVALGTTTANAAGNWSFTPTADLTEGLNNLTATSTNAAGNVSPETALYPIVVDTTAPGAITDPELTDDVGAVQGPIASGDTTDDATPTFSGKAEPEATIIVRDNGVEIGRATADQDGNWTFTPDQPLADGDHSMTAQPVDAAGNKGPETAPIAFVVDTSVPVFADISGMTDDVGSIVGSLTPGQVTDDARPTLSGIATPSSVVKIYDNGVEIGQVTANTDGEWSFTPATDLTDGAHALTVTATDASGTSAPSTAWDLIVDTLAPNVPVITSVVDDIGAVTGDIANGGTTDDKRPTINGTAEANSLVTVYVDGVAAGTVRADATGLWAFTPLSDLINGLHNITASATDEAGNVSGQTASWDITVAGAIPATPSITGLFDDFGDSTGWVVNGGRTDDQTPELHGNAIAGSTVNIYNGTTLLATVDAGADGKWVWDGQSNGQPLPLGLYNFNVTVTADGETSNKSADWTVAIGNDGTSGFEDFSFGGGSNLGSNSWYQNNTNTYASGLTISGYHEGLYSQTSGGPRTATMFIGRGALAAGPSNYNPALIWAEGTTDVKMYMNATNAVVEGITFVYVSIYDTAGKLITKINVDLSTRDNLNIFTPFTYVAPVGRLIGKITTTTSKVTNTNGGIVDYARVKIDDLSWGNKSFEGNAPRSIDSVDDDSIHTAAVAEDDVIHNAANAEAEPVAEESQTTDPVNDAEAAANAEQEAEKASDAATDGPAESAKDAETSTSPEAEKGKIADADVIEEHVLHVDSESHVLALTLDSVLESGADGLFIDDDSHQLIIKGQEGDKVELSDLLKDGTDLGDWSQVAGTVTVAGEKYEVYQHSGADVELLVQQGVQVELLNH